MDKCKRPSSCPRDRDEQIIGGATPGATFASPPRPAGWRRYFGASLVVQTICLAATLAVGPAMAQNVQATAVGAQSGTSKTSSIAFHYGANAPLAELRAFEQVVVEPSHGFDPALYAEKSAGRSQLLAYVSIGEVGPQRSYRRQMPAAMLAGRNPTWNSQIINQAHPDWPAFFVEEVITPLWQAGYRGFFLDTMDSYQALGSDAATMQAQRAGLVRTIKGLTARYPSARLITNRGFEFLAELRADIAGVAAESLFGRWDQRAGQYIEVPAADRDWLLARLREVQAAGLQAISIDYADPGNRDLTRTLATRIAGLGITPFVTDGALTSTGIGTVEVMPRRVLMVHNGTREGDEQTSPAHLKATMPLHYLGYRVDLLDLDRFAIPDGPLADRYAAVVGIFEENVTREADLNRLFERANREQVPLVLLNSLGMSFDNQMIHKLGLTRLANSLRGRIKISAIDNKVVGYEREPLADPRGLAIQAGPGSQSLLRLTDGTGQVYDGVAVTPWGGFAVRPFTFVAINKDDGNRWVIDPIEFMSRTVMRGQFRPIPDVTTENGRRLLMVHIDGDGFASRAEIPGSPFAAEVMYRDFISRYDIPHTVSVIEGETGPQGLYPELSPVLEDIARNIFKLDNVEIASHSYSHPFFWRSVVYGATHGVRSSHAEYGQHLPLKDYDFDLARDIDGSANYINTRLAPPGKRTSIFLWTGDCAPPAVAIAQTNTAGLLNMNGGDTTITRQNNSLTLVAPLSLRKNGWLQVLAPNQNENVYTNNWKGPYYGFERVIETFELTNSPRRLKPINIYYHTYSASKTSSITSLHRVYRYALKQSVHPIFSSQYIRKVHDFEEFATARELADNSGRQIWHLVGSGQLRTVRVPDDIARKINWRASTGIAGRSAGVDGSYLHLTEAHVRLVIEPLAQAALTHVVTANGRIDKLARDENDLSFRFSSHVIGQLSLAHPAGCRVKVNNKIVKPRAQRATQRQELPIYHYSLNKASHTSAVTIAIDC